MPLEEKIKYADFVIDNSGDREATRKQVDRTFAELSELA
jgi:dephospho-CoA kinase